MARLRKSNSNLETLAAIANGRDMIESSPWLTWLLGTVIVLYVAGMYGLAFAVRGRIRSTEDFLVAGRRLPLSLAWATLLATWFGAGTILAVTEEVTREGFQPAALDPIGAGFCLILAGFFFAKPLWKMSLLTLSNFFRRRFGPTGEILSACIMVPTYFGWVAAQLVALAGLLELFFGIDPTVGILLVAVVAMGYTLQGGMWSVTLTDAFQIVLVLAGLVVLAVTVLGRLGDGSLYLGILKLKDETPPEMLVLIPTDSFRSFVGWIAVFCVGALGNIPGQDLMQRIFAAKSAAVAQWAAVIAGVAYLTFGMIPILLGLAARLLVPNHVTSAILPALASLFLSPPDLDHLYGDAGVRSALHHRQRHIVTGQRALAEHLPTLQSRADRVTYSQPHRHYSRHRGKRRVRIPGRKRVHALERRL